ncbi:MAG: TlpA family protein disulfide reductase [Candidatus Baltobacteraceae bacterium]
MVHFWSISCYICHDVVEQVNVWREKYGQKMAFISVHQPRGPEELDIEKVTADALGAMKMTQPCAIDSDHAIVRRFENQFVPGYYVFNRQHQLRHFQAGDKGYGRIEGAIARIIDDLAEAVA